MLDMFRESFQKFLVNLVHDTLRLSLKLYVTQNQEIFMERRMTNTKVVNKFICPIFSCLTKTFLRGDAENILRQMTPLHSTLHLRLSSPVVSSALKMGAENYYETIYSFTKLHVFIAHSSTSFDSAS
jgi:hypothetical protein